MASKVFTIGNNKYIAMSCNLVNTLSKSPVFNSSDFGAQSKAR